MNTKNIINFTINVDPSYLSDNVESHLPEVYEPYRKILKELLSLILL